MASRVSNLAPRSTDGWPGQRRRKLRRRWARELDRDRRDRLRVSAFDNAQCAIAKLTSRVGRLARRKVCGCHRDADRQQLESTIEIEQGQNAHRQISSCWRSASRWHPHTFLRAKRPTARSQPSRSRIARCRTRLTLKPIPPIPVKFPRPPPA